MRREPKLSSDNELDLKYIMTFTVAFVVISSIILVAGYALLTATGILGQGQAEGAGTPTPVAGPTARPTYVVIGVSISPLPPDPTPVPPPPTPTPTPTPVPSPYKIGVILDQSRANSMQYNITLSAVPHYQPVDMTHTTLVITDGTTEYCHYSFTDAMYWLDGCWSNSNGDNRLDPTGESLTYEISAYSLKIPLNVETRFILYLDGTQILNVPLPAMQNYADTSGGSQDPGDQTVVQNPDNVVHWY